MWRLFNPATAIVGLVGCHARCSTFLPKSMLSTLMSTLSFPAEFFLRPVFDVRLLDVVRRRGGCFDASIAMSL